MSQRLILALDAGFDAALQQIEKDASVRVQFAAGHLHEIFAALKEYRAARLEPEQPPAQEPTAGIVAPLDTATTLDLSGGVESKEWALPPDDEPVQKTVRGRGR